MVIVVSLSSMCQEYEESGFLAYLQTNKLAYNKFIENFARDKGKCISQRDGTSSRNIIVLFPELQFLYG